MLAVTGGGFEPAAAVRNVPLTRVVHIPVATVRAQGTAGTSLRDSNLVISPGAPDELPEGPEGFDVFDDRTLLIADPLRDRLAEFDSKGVFKQEWRIGFAADSVTVTSTGLVLVREASTGALHAFDREGHPRTTEPAQLPEADHAVLQGLNRGIVVRSKAPDSAGALEVRFERPGFRLLSLESLITDENGNTYVALETTAGGESVDVKKIVRRYDAKGQLVAEISDMNVDYYVRPVDELRVHRGLVYQLMSSASEVLINIWDTN